jgi:hypothetical protein
MMAALLICTSMRGMESSARMASAAARTLERRDRSTWTNLMVVEGEAAAAASMTGWTRERERPRRMRAAGWPWAREVTVSAPRPPTLGPVMRT